MANFILIDRQYNTVELNNIDVSAILKMLEKYEIVPHKNKQELMKDITERFKESKE